MIPDCQINLCDVASLEDFPEGLYSLTVKSTLAGCSHGGLRLDFQHPCVAHNRLQL